MKLYVFEQLGLTCKIARRSGAALRNSASGAHRITSLVTALCGNTVKARSNSALSTYSG